MLEPRDIMRLRLDTARLSAHQKMPVPSYVHKPLIGQYSAISEAVISELLHIDTETFRTQLEMARKAGTSYIHVDRTTNKRIGVCGATSLIKGPVINKNIVVPNNNVFHSPMLDEHIIIGSFVRGQIFDGMLTGIEDLEVAGWARASDIMKWESDNSKPFNFKTNLPVIMMPCSMLNPINTLSTVIN
jgi:hypothetical protein